MRKYPLETTVIKLLLLSLITIFSSGCGLGSFKVGGKSGFFSKSSASSAITSPDQVSGLALWMDGGDETTQYTDQFCTTPVTINGDPVGCWEDKSSNGFQFTQAAPANMPTYKTNVINGESAILFTAASTTILSTNDDAWDFTKTNTVFVVAKNANIHDGVIFGNISTINGFLVRYRDNAGSSEMRFINLGALIFDLPLAAFDGTFTIFEYEDSGTDVINHDANAYFDGTFQGASGSAVGGNGADNNMAIGAAGDTSLPFDGYINEIIVYQPQISATNRVAVRNYLNTKYGIF